jgi:hypothetical protein
MKNIELICYETEDFDDVEDFENSNQVKKNKSSKTSNSSKSSKTSKSSKSPKTTKPKETKTTKPKETKTTKPKETKTTKPTGTKTTKPTGTKTTKPKKIISENSEYPKININIPTVSHSSDFSDLLNHMKISTTPPLINTTMPVITTPSVITPNSVERFESKYAVMPKQNIESIYTLQKDTNKKIRDTLKSSLSLELINKKKILNKIPPSNPSSLTHVENLKKISQLVSQAQPVKKVNSKSQSKKVNNSKSSNLLSVVKTVIEKFINF